ncbi:MAG: HD domain-containing protein, partial [Candidatus Margulisbacteria bacterium]|nr:HD domain-containing protein [Candidatus Margulisiibacteriota bacterium]
LMMPKNSQSPYQVAYIAYRLSKLCTLPKSKHHNLIIACLLSQTGLLSKKKSHHSVTHHILHSSILFNHSAPYFKAQRPHNWEIDRQIFELSLLISNQLKNSLDMITHGQGIIENICSTQKSIFKPTLIKAIQELSSIEGFWFDLAYPDLPQLVLDSLEDHTLSLQMSHLNDLSIIFIHMLGYWCKETAIHSGGVSEVAVLLSKKHKFLKRDQDLMRISGYFHDLGKISISQSILTHTGCLTKREYNIVKSHSYYTYRILDMLPGIPCLKEWAGYHHERENGNGYPFHVCTKEQDLGVQIMAVSDVFTALRETRYYRKGLSKEMSLSTLQMMAHSELNQNIVTVLKSHYDEIDAARAKGHKTVKALLQH